MAQNNASNYREPIDTPKVNENRRQAFKKLVDDEFLGELGEVEIVLKNNEKRKVTRRTIQAWLASPHKVSSRTCPPWALTCLQENIARNPDRKERLMTRRKLTNNLRNPSYYERLAEQEGKMNDYAESRLYSRAKVRADLCSAPANEFPSSVAAHFSRLEEKINSLSSQILCVFDTINEHDENSTVSDLKKTLYQNRLAQSLFDDDIAATARDIESGKNEFATDDGTLPLEGNSRD